jgi:probable rRNA maturation factor
VIPAVKFNNRQRKKPLNLCECQAFANAAFGEVWRRNQKALFPEQIDAFLISDRRIEEIHRNFLGIDGPTDVITFHHGEIFISVETAERHARQFSTSFSEEIHLCIVHAFLHLAGFDDRTKRDRKQMSAMQEEIVRKVHTALSLASITNCSNS